MREQISVKMNVMADTPRRLLGFVTVIGILAIVGASLTIPFLFESSTMYYKFGTQKAILRSAKMAGLAAAALLLVQLPLAARLKWLDKIFSLPGLYRIHRINAWAISILVLVHPVLIFTAEGTWKIPLESRYWPEWLGVTLLAAVLMQIGFSQWRSCLFRAYTAWRRFHIVLAVAVFSALILHMLKVSETFELGGLPRTLTVTVAVGAGLLWIWIRTSGLRSGRTPFRVTSVTVAGIDAYTVELEPAGPFQFTHLPGQFALLSLTSPHVSREFHPFTIASTPTRPDRIRFTIRCCGDWTNRIGALDKGTPARILGPFGRFSHLFLKPKREIIMIAGGIGITPMLSMLRYMNDADHARRITLVWSNRTRAHLFDSDELEAIGQKLTGFRWVPIFTREKNTGGQSGRMDRSALKMLLNGCSRDAAIFLCGPPAMVANIRAALRQMGFPSGSIYNEAFGF